MKVLCGGYYIHKETGDVMRLNAASMIDQWVELIDPVRYGRNGFRRSWFGTLREFYADWAIGSEVTE